MFKSLTAATLAIGLSIGALGMSTAPAKANDDLAKFVFGAIALGIVASSIANAQNNDHANVVIHNPPRNNRYRVPARCAREVRLGHNGRIATVYGRPCLRRNGVETARANSCSRTGTINGRNITYYTTRCLRRSGYVF